MAEVLLEAHKAAVRKSLQARRLERMNEHAKWIREHEQHVLSHLVDGDRIDPSQIEPFLAECRQASDHALWRYLRYCGSIPYSEYVGRRQRFLIRDRGHPNHPVMGIAALGSSVMNLRCRDRWIGWQVDTGLTAEEVERWRAGIITHQEARAIRSKRRERKQELRMIKRERLSALADLYVSQAVPPYNELTGGKLLCLMMLSNEVREMYRRKYADRLTLLTGRIASELAAIVTTSVYGPHSSMYNRLRFRDRLAYMPIGETEGFGSYHVDNQTFVRMRAYLTEQGREPSHAFGKGNNWRMRVVRTYHDLRRQQDPDYGLDGNTALLHGQRRGVFIAPLAHNARAFLIGEDNSLQPFDWPIEDLTEWWRARWLGVRTRNPEVMARVRSFRKMDHALSSLLPI